jgi:hypothetical protein
MAGEKGMRNGEESEVRRENRGASLSEGDIIHSGLYAN